MVKGGFFLDVRGLAAEGSILYSYKAIVMRRTTYDDS